MPVTGFTDLELKNVSLHEDILPRFSVFGNKTALIDGTNGKPLSYSELLGSILRVTKGLRQHGVLRGDRLLLCSHNSVNFIIMTYSALVAGATVVTMNPRYTIYEMTHQLTDCKPAWIFTSEDASTNLQRCTSNSSSVKGIIIDGNKEGFISFSSLLQHEESSQIGDVIIDPCDDVACILYSSGTSGLPKGVMLTHFNLVSNMLQVSHPDMKKPSPEEPISAGIQAGSVVDMAVLPLYHAFGLYRYVLLALREGHTIVVMPKFEPSSFLEGITKYKVTTLALVPPMVIFLAKSPLVANYDISSVVTVHCSAAPVPLSVARVCAQRFHVDMVTSGYGMTELSPVGLKLPYWARRPGSVGIPLPNTEAMVVDTDTGRELGAHKPGELWIRGPQVMKGYLNNLEATRKAIDDQGWMHTGDVAYFDEYRHFFIVDRVKELIKYKGFQVAPAEMEDLLLHHPAVADAAVIGQPDNEAGELPKAYIVCRPGTSISESDIQNFVKERVSAYKWLRGGVEFIKEIPKSPTGKILRRHLRDKNGKSKL